MARLEAATKVLASLATGFVGIAVLMGLGANLEAQTTSSCFADEACSEAKAYFENFSAIAMVLVLITLVLVLVGFARNWKALGAGGVA